MKSRKVILFCIAVLLILSACDSGAQPTTTVPAASTPAAAEATATTGTTSGATPSVGGTTTTTAGTTPEATTSISSTGNVAYPGTDAKVSFSGAGATFPEPLISKWNSDINTAYPNIKINYQGVGSGSGRTQFINKTVAFAATDAPLTDDQLTQAGGPDNAMHIPWVMGAVVLAYNVPGVTEKIKLDADTIAGIYLGTIQNWNDPKIAALNPGVTLPDQAITTVHRTDSSGTTDIFTDYLSKASADFKSQVGRSTLPTWPGGVGGQGNPGVTQLVKQTPGAIGYIEYGFAHSNVLVYALVKNPAGNFIDGGDPATVSEAAASTMSSIPADLRYSITNSSGPNAYPISGTDWALVYLNQTDHDLGKALAYYMWWATHEGQKYSAELGYAPIPAELVAKDEAQIKRMMCNGTPCFP